MTESELTQPTGLLTEAMLCKRLGIGERRLKQLRAEGVVPDPLHLGERAARWTEADYSLILQRLPRRAPKPEPEALAAGRRARIEAMKRSTGAA